VRARIILLAMLIAAEGRAQTNFFFYDNAGRLAVVLATNKTDAAFYDYDAVGNILAIRRQTVGPVNLFEYSPATAAGNATLTLQGTGFCTNLAQNTVVFCNTITAQVVSATPTQLKVLAPTNAVNCTIKVTTCNGTGSNSVPFTSSVGVTVAPSVVTLSGTFAQQFTATVYGTIDQNVTWFINGSIPAGSNTIYGMITSTGYYTAPTNVTSSGAVSVHARSETTTDPTKDGIATITLANPLGPIYSPTVSAQPGLPNVLGPIYSPTVSAQSDLPNVLGPIYSPTVSVGLPPPGYALLFNSTNYITTPYSSDLYPGTFTLECWVNFTGADDSRLNIVGNSGDDGGYRIMTDAGRAYGEITGFYSLAGLKMINDGQWHHIAFISDGDGMTLYTDGVSYGGAPTDGPYDNGLAFTVGAIPTTFESGLNGTIDEVMLTAAVKYTGTFTPERCPTNWNETVLHFTLDEGSGSTTTDTSGNGHNGTLQGSPVPSWVTPGICR